MARLFHSDHPAKRYPKPPRRPVIAQHNSVGTHRPLWESPGGDGRTLPDESTHGRQAWLGWAPLLLFPTIAIAFRHTVPPWIFMWILAVAIFAAFKWCTWWRAVHRCARTTPFRSIAFLCLWPGMDADRFLDLNRTVPKPALGLWSFAFAKTALGATLIWAVARLAGNGLAAGWIGMVGFIFLLHFGIFHLLALFWQRIGIDAPPLMRWPARATSLSDFWSKRWNAGFRDLAFGILFRKLAIFLPPRIATLFVFLVSGLIHELVITVPAGAAYGLPTTYFLIQGIAMLFERSRLGASLGLRRTATGRVFAITVVTLPIFALFPEPFVLRVMVPFFQAVKALP